MLGSSDKTDVCCREHALRLPAVWRRYFIETVSVARVVYMSRAGGRQSIEELQQSTYSDG